MDSDHYREFCFSHKKEECEVCGDSNEVLVHHIDGDRTNNKLENLLPVCREHHAKIHYGHEEVKQYSRKLPSDKRSKHISNTTNGRKTITLPEDSFTALEHMKNPGESWGEFAWRMASVLQDQGRWEMENEEFAELVAKKTAEKLDE